MRTEIVGIFLCVGSILCYPFLKQHKQLSKRVLIEQQDNQTPNTVKLRVSNLHQQYSNTYNQLHNQSALVCSKVGCQNNGVCLIQGNNSEICQCQQQFYGLYCELNITQFLIDIQDILNILTQTQLSTQEDYINELNFTEILCSMYEVLNQPINQLCISSIQNYSQIALSSNYIGQLQQQVEKCLQTLKKLIDQGFSSEFNNIKTSQKILYQSLSLNNLRNFIDLNDQYVNIYSINYSTDGLLWQFSGGVNAYLMQFQITISDSEYGITQAEILKEIKGQIKIVSEQENVSEGIRYTLKLIQFNPEKYFVHQFIGNLPDQLRTMRLSTLYTNIYDIHMYSLQNLPDTKQKCIITLNKLPQIQGKVICENSLGSCGLYNNNISYSFTDNTTFIGEDDSTFTILIDNPGLISVYFQQGKQPVITQQNVQSTESKNTQGTSISVYIGVISLVLLIILFIGYYLKLKSNKQQAMTKPKEQQQIQQIAQNELTNNQHIEMKQYIQENTLKNQNNTFKIVTQVETKYDNDEDDQDETHSNADSEDDHDYQFTPDEAIIESELKNILPNVQIPHHIKKNLISLKKIFSIPFYVRDKDFLTKEFIGKGNSASVYKCILIGHEGNFVIKLFDSIDNSHLQTLGKNGFIKIPHPNILDPHGIALDYQHNTKLLMIGIIYPKIQLNLKDFLKKRRNNTEFTLNNKLKLAENITKGIQHLHDVLNIVHKDIKPTNILIDEEENCKITDYAMDAFLNNQQFKQLFTFNPRYTPPEAFRINDDNSIYQLNQSFDIWSFGLIIYEIFYEQQAWGDDVNEWIITENLAKKQLFKINENLNVPKEIQEFIEMSLNFDKDKRPTIKLALSVISNLQLKNT